ncbi:MAG: DUF1906 domain-containing protein, partial [Streptosporangiales bacterium]|nr:DUF1906 domain-containing protein [Streptosporangiales bacterium]
PTPTPTPSETPKPKPKKPKKPVAVTLNGSGFDTCAAPSLRAMRAWRGAFDAANIYIGGAARACGYGNLSRTWVREVKKMGWHLIPTYVGFQAPCAPFRTRMTASRAAAQGRASADDAIERARHFGLPKGVPIYFDMEAYDSRNDSCRRAVLLFLDAWSERLKDRGYTSGVYSSAAAAARDLGRSVGIRLPDSIWFAHWDGRASVWDSPYLSNKWWSKRQRIKQYRGPHREKHGGYTLTIDSNRVYGHVW